MPRTEPVSRHRLTVQSRTPTGVHPKPALARMRFRARDSEVRQLARRKLEEPEPFAVAHEHQKPIDMLV